MAQIIWTDAALGDLANIYEYLAKSTQSFDRAEQFCIDLMAHAQSRLSILPKSGSLVQELVDWQAREIYYHSFRVIYIERGDACYINMCIHGSRDLARQLDPERWEALP